ncbi:hypothetical protein ABBQ38_000722 [Trebouxia sp. C0009 RCD-2024]
MVLARFQVLVGRAGGVSHQRNPAFNARNQPESPGGNRAGKFSLQGLYRPVTSQEVRCLLTDKRWQNSVLIRQSQKLRTCLLKPLKQ